MRSLDPPAYLFASKKLVFVFRGKAQPQAGATEGRGVRWTLTTRLGITLSSFPCACLYPGANRRCIFSLFCQPSYSHTLVWRKAM